MDLTLIGRSVLVIGGAYLLRAATELDAVPDALGVALGFAYALALLVLADRAAARRHGLDAALHGVTAVLVAYPLIAELVMRFHFLSPWSAAVAIALVCAAGLGIAARRRAVPLAWIVVGATLVAAVGMGFVTRSIVPYAWTLVLLATATGWLGTRLDQPLLVWPPAVAADFLLVVALTVLLTGRELPQAGTTTLLAPLMFVLFAGSAMARSAADRSDTTLGDMALVLFALVIGFGGGAAAAVATGWGLVYGVAGLVLAVVGSVLALRMQSIPYWTSLWLAVALASLIALTGGQAVAFACVAIGVALLVAGRRLHATAELQAVVLFAVAAVASGLVVSAWHGMIGPPTAALPGPAALVTLAALVAASLFAGRDDGSRLAWVTKLLALVLTFVHTAGVIAETAIAAISASPARASAIRTAVLALGAIAIAAVARSPRARPAAVLVYPVLGLAVAKLLLEDLAVGTAATQTVGLASLGAALIIAQKLRPRSQKSA